MTKRRTASKLDPNPFGVPLHDLVTALEGSGLAVERDRHTLTARSTSHDARVDIVRPERQSHEGRPIKAVVQIRSFLPSQLAGVAAAPESTVGMNYAAALGAVTVEDGTAYVGSRLTMYEGDDAWGIQFPLLLFSVTTGAETLLAAMRRMLLGEAPKRSASRWKKADFTRTEKILSGRCLCTTDAHGLVTEFGLTDGAVSAALGDSATALWRIRNDVTHPVLGGGLFCLLEMPNRLPSPAALDHALVDLNRREMAPEDLPPHFGAWTRGRFGTNPAYVSFLPNILHEAPGIAVNVSAWAYERARWASSVLPSPLRRSARAPGR